MSDLIEKNCKKCGSTFTTRTNKDLCRKCRPGVYSKIDHACAHCGNMFTSMPDTLYCSSCKKKHLKHATICTSCGKEFTAYYEENTCEKCRHAKRMAENRKRHICTVCGKEYEATYSSSYLCATCADLAGRQMCTCVVCGKQFLPRRRNEQCKTCSRTCQGYYIQKMGYGMKYNDEELWNKLVDIVKLEGPPLGIEELLKKAGGVTHKVLTTRGWKLKDIVKDAGYGDDYFPASTSEFEKSVYYVLVEIFGKDAIVMQKKFPDCKRKNFLPFDFYIEKYNLLVEADGRQHYDKKDHWYEHASQTDKIKTEYCLTKGINLLRVQYERYQSTREQLKEAIVALLPLNEETRLANCFNCWNGSEMIPISSQASSEEGSTTIPQGSTLKRVEMGSTQTGKAVGEDIVWSAGNT